MCYLELAPKWLEQLTRLPKASTLTFEPYAGVFRPFQVVGYPFLHVPFHL